MADEKAPHKCEICGLRKKAEEKPNAFVSKLWRWHTKWCPGWKSYQKELADREVA